MCKFPTQCTPVALRARCFHSVRLRGGFSFNHRKSGIDRSKLKGEVKALSSTMDSVREKNKKEVNVFDTKEDLEVSLAKYTTDLSDKFSRERGSFTIVLSVRSLIKSLRSSSMRGVVSPRKLVEPPHFDSLDWSKWHVFWVDERVVPKDHVDSNYKLTFDEFLCQVPILPGHVYAINDSLSAEGAANDYETCLKHLVHCKILDSAAGGFPKFDLMLLGMAHTVWVQMDMLLLYSPGILSSMRKRNGSRSSRTHQNRPQRGSPFTFPVINSSAYIALVVTGSGKADAVRKAVDENQSLAELPVQMVSPEGVLTCFLDKGAASKL